MQGVNGLVLDMAKLLQQDVLSSVIARLKVQERSFACRLLKPLRLRNIVGLAGSDTGLGSPNGYARGVSGYSCSISNHRLSAIATRSRMPNKTKQCEHT